MSARGGSFETKIALTEKIVVDARVGNRRVKLQQAPSTYVCV